MGIDPTKYNLMRGLGPGRQAPKLQPPYSGLAACMTAYFQHISVKVIARLYKQVEIIFNYLYKSYI